MLVRVDASYPSTSNATGKPAAPQNFEPRAVLNTTVPWSTTWFTGKMSGLPSTTTASRPTGAPRSNASDS